MKILPIDLFAYIFEKLLQPSVLWGSEGCEENIPRLIYIDDQPTTNSIEKECLRGLGNRQLEHCTNSTKEMFPGKRRT